MIRKRNRYRVWVYLIYWFEWSLYINIIENLFFVIYVNFILYFEENVSKIFLNFFINFFKREFWGFKEVLMF